MRISVLRTSACMIAAAWLAAACGQAASAPSASPSGVATSQGANSSRGTATASAAAGAAARAAKHVSLVLDFLPAGYQATFVAALKNGYFKASGLNVSISSGKGSLTTVEQVASGAAMFGFADFGAGMQAIAKGAPVRVVMALTQQTPLCIATRASAGVTKPAQLKGLRFAIHAGGVDSYMLPAFLNANRLSKSYVKSVNVSPTEKLVAFEDKRVDALLTFTNTMIPILESKGIKLNTMCLPKYGLNLLEDSLFTSNQTIRTDPATVKAFVAATTRGYQFAAAHPNQAIADLLSFFPQSGLKAAVAKQQLEATLALDHTPATVGKPLGWTAQSDVQKTLAIYKQYLGLKTDKPPSAFYTNRFIPAGGASAN